MAGAWLVQITYVGGANLNVVYPPLLPLDLRSRVRHLPQENSTVNCPIVGAQETDDLPVPPCWWDPTYVWPEPPTPPVVEAPVGIKNQFITAVDQLLDKMPRVIIDHVYTHDPETDEVTQKFIQLQNLVYGAGYNEPE